MEKTLFRKEALWQREKESFILQKRFITKNTKAFLQKEESSFAKIKKGESLFTKK